MVEPVFDRQHVETLRPSIQRTVDEFIDAMTKLKPPVDFVQQFALPVPYKVEYGLYRTMMAPWC